MSRLRTKAFRGRCLLESMNASDTIYAVTNLYHTYIGCEIYVSLYLPDQQQKEP